jgi:hypothetical protein
MVGVQDALQLRDKHVNIMCQGIFRKTVLRTLLPAGSPFRPWDTKSMGCVQKEN